MSATAPGCLAHDLDQLLPQTQCTRCGYPGCRPYAQAIARGEAEINQCPPGGAATIEALARRLARMPVPLNPRHGAEGPARIAVIDEQRCIGCARCLPPCPVDAILGAARQLHSVLVELCTGCELCLAPCPVDCISMVPLANLRPGAALPAPALNRSRHVAREARLARRATERRALLDARKRAAGGLAAGDGEAQA